jgi:hypothetical protein
MPQMLIIDSLVDQRFKPFFEKTFFAVGVRVIWNYFENIGNGKPAGDEFKKNIQSSDALFLILNRGIQSLSKAQDLVFAESGFVGHKDVWAFEYSEDLYKISLRVPDLKHLTNAWKDYVAETTKTFERDKKRQTLLSGAKFELLSPASISFFFDYVMGTALFHYSASPPMGFKTTRPPYRASYNVHPPSDTDAFPCRICDYFHEIKLLSKEPVPAMG